MKSKDKRIEETLKNLEGIDKTNFGVRILKIDWREIFKKTGIKILIIFLIILILFMVLK